MCVCVCVLAMACSCRCFICVYTARLCVCVYGRTVLRFWSVTVKQTWLGVVSFIRRLTGGRRQEGSQQHSAHTSPTLALQREAYIDPHTLLPLLLPANLQVNCDSPRDSRLWPRVPARPRTLRHPSPLTPTPTDGAEHLPTVHMGGLTKKPAPLTLQGC